MTRMTEIYKSVAFAAAAALVFSATPAKADALSLSGSVTQVCSITTSSGTAGSLDLSASSADVTMATVAEACNSPDGYTVTIVTTNGVTTGVLVSQNLNGANDTDLNYTISYDAVGLTFVSGSVTAATRTGFTDASTKATVPIGITYTIPAGGLPADSYTDTLTLTLTAAS